ncbi:MAG TPA: LytTR family DNA-binding domain-containing protein [Chryseolinea sp.]|nr:LytTR family DNA-binding domain-containing protein [Chryseolinea sp.]HPH45591.1 LytTR family DNA-binding domain-containing protein [Chryseolinea sp.]HPM30531.1 LytTR family DNA-binding domain-containing protein [Chryseolinea sp.]
MNILIIEDEPLVAKDLQNQLLTLVPESRILAVISSVERAQKWFKESISPDLVISDIQLSDGISFVIFEALHLQCPIIFTTAYDEYAIRAFKLNSIDYLLKPIDHKELAAALDKYKSLNRNDILNDQLKALMGHWRSPEKKFKERFLAVQRNTLVPITQSEIAFFHKEELIYLHTMSNEKFICEHQTMDEVESMLNPEIFFRVNRQFIIHIQSTAKVKTTHKGLTVQLKSPFHTEIDISREKAVAFKNWLG